MPKNYNAVRTQKALPIGSVMPWTGVLTRIPKGWLLCNGAEIRADEYPLLARILKDSYGGTGFDGSFPTYEGTFRLPAVNQKTLADIGPEHFNANASIAPSSIDDSAAGSAVIGFMGDEGDLGPPSTVFATTDINFTYTPDPDGFIVSYNFSGSGSGIGSTQVFKNISATGSATGTGVLFNVIVASDGAYTPAIKNKGQGYKQGDTLTISGSSIGGGANLIITVNSVGSSTFSGTVEGQTFIGGAGSTPVYVIPRKLGRNHMPQHVHPGSYETVNKNDATDTPGLGVGVWDNPQIFLTQTYRQLNGDPNNYCSGFIFDEPDGPISSTGVANFWGEQTGPTSGEATVGAAQSPFRQGYGSYALAVIGGTRPARSHIPFQTSSASHGVGKPWFTSAKKLRTRVSGETETADLNNIRNTGRLNINSVIPFSVDVNPIKEPNYDSGGNGSDLADNFKKTLYNTAGVSFTRTSRSESTVNDVIETHDHEGEFLVTYDPGNLNIKDFISVQCEPNLIPDSVPDALQIGFILTSPSVAITNLIRAY
jgi:hypothetical protein